MKQQKSVVLGLSGGVDSSVAALLLKKQGYKVIGVFMKNYSETKDPITGECSWIEEKKMAQKIAAILEIPFITIDYEKQYKALVINEMFKSYKSGLTPNPDILCNKIIKFPALWKEAKKFKADYVATGHYARIKKSPNGFFLLQGKDKTKDQSYFLCDLTQDDLSHTLFPLGNLKKSQVGNIAKKHHFPNWDKKGTRGICFIGKLDMKSFLKKKRPEEQGIVLSPEGLVIGTHPGIYYFTIGERIGERKGFIINKEFKKQYPGKLYVAEKTNNTITLAPESHFLLKRSQIFIKKFYRINPKEKIPDNLKARIRHLSFLVKGKLIKKSNKILFKFNKPQEALAPGQTIVLYSNEKLIASGEIRLN